MSIQLEPETEARLRQQAAQRGVTVDDLVREALVGVRRDNCSSLDVRHVASTDRSSEMAWLSNPHPELVGKWVVLAGSRIASIGPTAEAVYNDAKAQGIEVPFLVYISPHTEPFVGGWLD